MKVTALLSQLWSGYALPTQQQKRMVPRSAQPGRKPLKIRGALSKQTEPPLTDRKWALSFLPQLEDTLAKLDIFTANTKDRPKISLITGAAALARFGDEAAAQRLVIRLPENLRDKAQAEIAKIVADTGTTPCSSYLN